MRQKSQIGDLDAVADSELGRNTDTLHPLRVLVVTNFQPDAAAPQRGRWVLDQVEGIRRHGIEVEVFSFAVGKKHYGPATREIRARLKRRKYDLVHAHYGLAGWCARLAGASPLVVTFHGTDVRHRIVGPMSRRLARHIHLVAGVSQALFEPENGRPGLPRVPGASAVLPCGPDLARFRPLPQREARQALGLDPENRFLFFPANPGRPEKRADRARQLATACGTELWTGGGIEPEKMPFWLNAANAVLITSENEGFGLAGLEGLACNVPVLSTPVGIAPFALAGIEGCLAEPFEVDRWAAAARPHLERDESRIEGSARAAQFASDRMADRVVHAYGEILGEI